MAGWTRGRPARVLVRARRPVRRPARARVAIVVDGVAAVAVAGGRVLKVCAVVVTWRPDLALLDEALAALRPQVAAVLVIDNASPECAEIAARVAHAGGRFHGMRRNVGLARAQNLGARWAWAAGMDAILLMDQDSVAAPDMVALLAAPHLRSAVSADAAQPDAADASRSGLALLPGTGAPLVCTAPLPVDARTGMPMRLIRTAAPAGQDDDLVPCAFVIASGMLIPRAAWRCIGPMCDALFIDHVDTEWCLRARAAGGALAAVPAARLMHRLGTDGRRVWLGRWRYFPHHSPMRHYYMVRNSLALRRLPHVRAGMARWLAWRAALLVLVSLVVLPERRRRWRAVRAAIADARAGRGGPAPRAW